MTQETYRVEVVDAGHYKRIISCQDACPARTDASGYVNAIARGEYGIAYRIAREPNPFVVTCGRICKAPCEAACRRGKIDAPVAIRALKRFATEWGKSQSQPPTDRLENAKTVESLAALTEEFGAEEAKPQSSRKVAIVGAGPAGLTAAHDLLLMGYKVTIFEFLPFPGGTIRTGIPGFRLPTDVVDQEVQEIIALGAELVTDAFIEDSQSLSRLKKQGYEAIFIATGADFSRKLSRPEEGIFAEGDMLFDVVAVIDAVGAGHRAARAIHHYLRGAQGRVVTRAQMSWVSPKYYLKDDRLQIERENPPMRSAAAEAGVLELEECYSEAEAREQAERCLQCHVQTVFNGDLCILCGGCVDVCPQNCLKMVRLDKTRGGQRFEALVEARYGVPLQALQKGGALKQGTAMIKDETRCVRCGLCAKRCPTGAITMEAFWFEEEFAYDQKVADSPAVSGKR